MDPRLLTGSEAPDRYDGRPFLRLLECYVLASVGALSAEHAELLEELTPKLQATYGVTGTWQQVVAHEMDFDDELPGAFRAMWDRNVAASVQTGTYLDAEAWARHAVDTNLV